MSGYNPLKITGTTTGLVQERENFLLPDDAYPVLENAYVFRERIKRKKGYQLLGRLRRNLADISLGMSGASPWTFNLFTAASISLVKEPNAQIQLGSVVIEIGSGTTTGSILTYNNSTNCEVTTTAPHGLITGNRITISGVMVIEGTGPDDINGGPYTVSVVSPTSFTINMNSLGWGVYESGGTWLQEGGTQTLFDQGDGTLATDPASATVGTINYFTGAVTITNGLVGQAATVDFGYYPGLPVMGIRIRELDGTPNDQTLFFDQVYCYKFNSGDNQFEEFLPATATTWNASGQPVSGTDFFWSTNYWSSANPPFTTSNQKLFWVTNNTGRFGANQDPVRITDGTTWVDFNSGTWNKLDATNFLTNFLCMLPFRGRMVTFNTYEGTSNDGTGSQNFSNRIRWSTIGNPFIPFAAGPPSTGSWRDDIRGQGGFLDIPTNEDIVAVGFVRDNLVIYCERSTWQLRYTGRSIAPFQIEKVNSELGAEGTFSAVQFDTSLVGIGDRGVVECDSYKSNRIDVKIPDLVFLFNSSNNGVKRVHGIRDFPNRLAYWTFPGSSKDLGGSRDTIFPTRRLVYNYENDSWAIFTDSLTTLGTYYLQSSATWINTRLPWVECNFPWISNPLEDPVIVGGNQQGFVEKLDITTTNDVSLFITNITGNTNTATRVTSPNHNMQTGFIIGISGIASGTPFDNLNGGIFGIQYVDANNFDLFVYDSDQDAFTTPQTDDPAVYIGGGLINIRDNFSIKSKKFNFLDDGQSIQLGYLDILMAAGENANPGEISLYVYLDYNDAVGAASNTSPNNAINNGLVPSTPDRFFNTVIPTTPPSAQFNTIGGTKFWQRVFCPTRGNFLTLQYTLSNGQMAGKPQEQDVQIDAQVLWIRKAGRMTNI